MEYPRKKRSKTSHDQQSSTSPPSKDTLQELLIKVLNSDEDAIGENQHPRVKFLIKHKDDVRFCWDKNDKEESAIERFSVFYKEWRHENKNVLAFCDHDKAFSEFSNFFEFGRASAMLSDVFFSF